MALSEIDKIEREDWIDSCRWYIWDNSGHRYWLTSNYGNPCERIMELIKKLNSDVIEITT